jgi:ATP-binding cassette subfamily B protein
VIIDKVIAQRSLDTLQILGMALVVVTLMEGVIGALRTFLFTDTTNRIDLRLGAEVIDHLLRLPLGYFDRRPVGELGSRIAELEKIRNFLTGQALMTLLDAAFSVIYIIVMAIYSWLLTIIALGVLPIQIALTLLGAPLFRRQYRQAAEENARTQSHLVEVLTGIQTVKAQNVEMVSRWKWQDFYSKYIARTFEKTITGTFLNETSQVLQKLSQLLVLWVGAAMVAADTPILVMAGHADSQNIGGSGTPGEAVARLGAAPMYAGISDELYWNMVIAQAVVALGQAHHSQWNKCSAG